MYTLASISAIHPYICSHCFLVDSSFEILSIQICAKSHGLNVGLSDFFEVLTIGAVGVRRVMVDGTADSVRSLNLIKTMISSKKSFYCFYPFRSRLAMTMTYTNTINLFVVKSALTQLPCICQSKNFHFLSIPLHDKLYFNNTNILIFCSLSIYNHEQVKQCSLSCFSSNNTLVKQENAIKGNEEKNRLSDFFCH